MQYNQQQQQQQYYYQSEEQYSAPSGAPPAYYTNTASPAYQAVSDSKHGYPAGHGKTTIRFPQQMVFTYRVGRTHSHLGEVKDHPLYLVRIPRWSMGWSDIVLLGGTDKLDAPLASAGVEKGSKLMRTAIKVMPHRGSALQHPFETSMNGNYKAKHQFTIPVGADGHMETFEWRQSKGKMVKELVGGFQFGLKLVRLQGGAPVAPRASSSSAHSDSDADEMAGVTSDGKSVVAVFAGERWRYNNANFRFNNEGSTGELGELFEIVAVMTFIRLFEMQLTQGASVANSSSAAAASSSAAAAVV